jgi:serine/threonine-protein kinase
MKGDGDVETATVPPLEDEPAPVSPPVVPPPPPMAPQLLAPPPPRVELPPRTGLSSRRIAALVTGGAGVVGVGLGTYFGLTAIKKHNDPNAVCPGNGVDCSGQDDLNRWAGFNADASTVSFAVGLAALAAGAYLWFGDTSVTVSTGVGSLAVQGRF